MYMCTVMHFLFHDVCLLTNCTHCCLISYSKTFIQPREFAAKCRQKVPRNSITIQA